MFKVTFAFENGSEVEAFANAGDNLLEVARGANVAIDAPCSGNGACGKCRVQLKGGELDSKKTLHISDEEFEKESEDTALKADFDELKNTYKDMQDYKFMPKISQLENAGIEILYIHEKDGHIDLNDLMAKLGEKNIDSILLDGGGTLNWSALESGIVNKVLAYVAPKLFGGSNADDVLLISRSRLSSWVALQFRKK